MIYLIIQSYFIILLSIGISAFCLFFLGLYFIFKKPIAATKHTRAISEELVSEKPVSEKFVTLEITSTVTAKAHDASDLQHLTAIAGDDLLSSQLDLARAYVETGRKQRAKTILESVVSQGNAIQQQEAQHLLSTL